MITTITERDPIQSAPDITPRRIEPHYLVTARQELERRQCEHDLAVDRATRSINDSPWDEVNAAMVLLEDAEFAYHAAYERWQESQAREARLILELGY